MCLASEICGTTRSLVTVQRLGCADLLSLYHRCLPTTRRPLTGATTIHQGAARASSTPSTLVTAVRCTRVQTIGQIRSFFRGKHSTKLEQTGAQRERPGVPHFWKKLGVPYMHCEWYEATWAVCALKLGNVRQFWISGASWDRALYHAAKPRGEMEIPTPICGFSLTSGFEPQLFRGRPLCAL